jgi:hypothetical protein
MVTMALVEYSLKLHDFYGPHYMIILSCVDFHVNIACQSSIFYILLHNLQNYDLLAKQSITF